MTFSSARVFALFALPLFAACQGVEVGDSGAEDAVDAELRQCATGPTVTGIDVSYYQGTIDWSSVKRSGRAFAFVRVSDGAHFKDPKFDRNWEGVSKEGLYRGAYQYFRASQDPIAQAELLLDEVGALGPMDLPPALDIETLDGERGSVVASHAQAWVDHVEAALGRKPLIYIGAGFAQQMGDPASLAAAPLWVANWKAACPRMPTAWNDKGWQFWQTRVTSGVPGVRTNVDADLFNGTVEQLAAYAGAGQ